MHQRAAAAHVKPSDFAASRIQMPNHIAHEPFWGGDANGHQRLEQAALTVFKQVAHGQNASRMKREFARVLLVGCPIKERDAQISDGKPVCAAVQCFQQTLSEGLEIGFRNRPAGDGLDADHASAPLERLGA